MVCNKRLRTSRFGGSAMNLVSTSWHEDRPTIDFNRLPKISFCEVGVLKHLRQRLDNAERYPCTLSSFNTFAHRKCIDDATGQLVELLSINDSQIVRFEARVNNQFWTVQEYTESVPKIGHDADVNPAAVAGSILIARHGKIEVTAMSLPDVTRTMPANAGELR